MFCPKCGVQNPENGKFCRSCGTDLGGVSRALTGSGAPQPPMSKNGRPITIESAITKFATGLAFLAISVVLAVTNMAGGRVWWYWMLIPAFIMIGGAIGQYLRIRQQNESGTALRSNANRPAEFSPHSQRDLPPQQTPPANVGERYRTGDLVPHSVTDSTTKHLEMNSEGETMTLPKR